MVRNPLAKLRDDENAVSPVIGVILMVAVTVILAAVIAGFVMGMGDNVGESAPNANIDFSYDANDATLSIDHTSGKVLNPSNTGSLTLSGTYIDGTSGDKTDFFGSSSDLTVGTGTTNVIDFAGVLTHDGDGVVTIDSDEEIASGTTIVEIYGDSSDGDEIASATLSWVSTSGETSSTLGEWSS